MNNQNENEIWADVPGFEGSYKISNFGRVKSEKRYAGGKLVREKYLKLFPMPKTKYLAFNARDKKRYKTFLVSRLVGLLFVEKPEDWNENWSVCYKVNDRNNCKADNLFWASELPKSQLSVRVVQLSKDGQFLAEYESQGEAAKATGVTQANISFACNPERAGNMTAGGYRWMRAEDYYKND